MRKITTPKLFTVLTTVILLGCLAFTNPAHAQQGMAALKDKTPEERAQMQTTFMKAKLQLDSTQTTQVQAINLKYAEKMDPILKDTGRKLKEMREIQSIQKDKDADLKKVFTAGQYKQYKDAEAEMREKLKEAKNGN